MPKTVRMQDIAERLGVSVVTVSKALAEKDGVSEETREKVKRLAREIGYSGPGSKEAARKHGTGVVGVLISSRYMDMQNSFYWAMYERVISRLLASDYYGIMELVRPEQEKEGVLPRILQEDKAEGIIVIGQLLPEYCARLRAVGGIPFVFMDSYNSDYYGDAVISDGYYGMYVMTSHLISMGHRDIFYVGSPDYTSSIRDRYLGYCSAMLEHGLALTGDMQIGDRDEGGAMHIVLPDRLPTAFACNCDMAAYRVIALLRERGLRVPEDISVVGFDDYTTEPFPPPAVTTYTVDMNGMARACVSRLLRRLSQREDPPMLKSVGGHISIKDSVRRIRDA